MPCPLSKNSAGRQRVLRREEDSLRPLPDHRRQRKGLHQAPHRHGRERDAWKRRH